MRKLLKHVSSLSLLQVPRLHVVTFITCDDCEGFQLDM
jgi:hypothetical protein